MKPSSFQDKLHNIQTAKGTNRALLLIPRLTKMPLPMQRYDDPFLPFGKAVIAATQDLVCAYVFDLGAYLALGAAGAVALERTIASVDDTTVSVLHAPFVGSGYIEAAEAFNVDAVTLALVVDAETYRAAGFGTFWREGAFLLEIGGETQLSLLGEDVLYAGHDDDFAVQVRAALQ